MTAPLDNTEKTVESLYWSFITYLVTLLFPEGFFSLGAFGQFVSSNIAAPEKVLFNGWFLKSYFFIIVLSFFLGLFAGNIIPYHLLTRFTGRNQFARVWDDFFRNKAQQAADEGVWIEMKDGSQWIGKLNSASDTPGDSELWLTGIRKFDNDVLHETVFTDMLIRQSEISRIFVLEEGTCKPLNLGEQTSNQIARKEAAASLPVKRDNKESAF